MKIIFLDFDGVLNNINTLSKRNRDNPSLVPLSLEWWAVDIDPDLVARVNAIIDRTGARVVVSSSWRCGADLDWLRSILGLRGFTGSILDMTPRSRDNRPRSAEIDQWLRERGEATTSYVILDDDEDAGIEGHFVHTSFETGITDADVERAVEILGSRT